MKADAAAVREGNALCLSGGGYRAMVFHLGALWRLNELGLLPRIARISSVSGGSITAGVLGMNWSQLDFDAAGMARAFIPAVVEPIRRLARHTIDVSSILRGIAMPGSVSDRVMAAYDDLLGMDGKTLQDLPEYPRFVINATNLQSRVLWRFSKPYMGDYLVGRVFNPTIPLSQAVAASSAFPPVLSPMVLKLDPESFAAPSPGEQLHTAPYTSSVVLSDGGVYDNLGLETAWKRTKVILVSDGGGATMPEPEPHHDWIRQTLRVLNVIDNQVRSLRKRELIAAFQSGEIEGTYWGMRTNIADYGLATALACPHERTMALAGIETRLEKMPDTVQEQLIDWGYAVADAAMRRHIAGVGGAKPRCPFGTFADAQVTGATT